MRDDLSPAARKYAELAEQGYSMATTARLLNVSRWAVGFMARRYGIEFEPGYSDADRDDRIVDLHGQGMTCVEIAEEVGAPYQSIRAAVKRLGLAPNRAKRRGKWDDALRECAALGFSYSEAAQHIGTNPTYISALSARLGIELADGRSKRRR